VVQMSVVDGRRESGEVRVRLTKEMVSRIVEGKVGSAEEVDISSSSRPSNAQAISKG